MFAHETALVYITVHAIDVPFACVLPHGDVAVVGKFGFALGVLGNHELVAVYLAFEVVVVEVGESVKQGFLLVGFFHKHEELL